ncbi:unnamed protein product [Sphenostylis stenocarpa]|uniref:Uncharacterized protein n=1 Tax=Sphenostylis stenocarpa TaxID=92480 RepID=A0AA86VQC3_9FABA|nr:unnamed protein product [Sphenostylis stenocarpa]
MTSRRLSLSLLRPFSVELRHCFKLWPLADHSPSQTYPLTFLRSPPGCGEENGDVAGLRCVWTTESYR